MNRISGKLDHDSQLIALGRSIRARRKELGISQEALALQSGIDRSHFGRIERGERNLTLLNLLRICEALELTASSLLSNAGM